MDVMQKDLLRLHTGRRHREPEKYRGGLEFMVTRHTLLVYYGNSRP